MKFKFLIFLLIAFAVFDLQALDIPYELFVDGKTRVKPLYRDGSKHSPFKKIQDALNDIADKNYPVQLLIHIAGGDYPEDLVIKKGYNRSIALVAHQEVSVKSIGLHINGMPHFNVRSEFTLQSAMKSLVSGVFTVKESFSVYNPYGVMTHLTIQGAQIDGHIIFSTPESLESGISPIHFIALDSYVTGKVNPSNAKGVVLDFVDSSEFRNLVTVDAYSMVSNSVFNGLSFLTNPEVLGPVGFFNSAISGVVRGTSRGVDLYMDEYTGYWIENNSPRTRLVNVNPIIIDSDITVDK